jgi:hypothetical protein
MGAVPMTSHGMPHAVGMHGGFGWIKAEESDTFLKGLITHFPSTSRPGRDPPL